VDREARQGQHEIVDLRQLRTQVLASEPAPPPNLGPPQRTWARPPMEIRRAIKVMLFADVKGFSNLPED
jgi:hypothetical protein